MRGFECYMTKFSNVLYTMTLCSKLLTAEICFLAGYIRITIRHAQLAFTTAVDTHEELDTIELEWESLLWGIYIHTHARTHTHTNA